MDVSLGALFNIYSFSTGRYLFALQQVLTAAQGAALTPLATHCQAALAHGRETRELENHFAIAQNQPKGNPSLVAIDNRIDRALVGLRDAAQAHIDAAGDESNDEPAKLARDLLSAIFPKGVKAVTQSTFVEELSLIDGVLTEIKANHTATITKLGLALHLDRVSLLQEEYRKEQNAAKKTGPDSSEVRAARARTQEYLLEVMGMIVGQYPLTTKADVEARQKLLGPILVQSEAIGSYLRARRAVEDVNPDTGEVEPNPNPPATPPQPAPAANQ